MIFVEPASAASIAGVIKMNKQGYFGNDQARLVCTVTGHGLKDPDRAIKCVKQPQESEADKNEILDLIF